MTSRTILPLVCIGLLAAGCSDDTTESPADSRATADVRSDAARDRGLDQAADAVPALDQAAPDQAAPDQAAPDAAAPDQAAPDAASPDAKQGYHPKGYKSSKVHGLAANLQNEDCRKCHGADRRGAGAAVSCDSCHKKGWRTSCVYCHGGDKDKTGAPPVDIDGAAAAAKLSFAPHAAHVGATITSPMGCKQCHVKPAKVLDKGHMFDNTPGKAEVAFSGGLGAGGAYAAGTCSSLYCHGNGRGKNGKVKASATKPGCDGCHPYVTSATTQLSLMSGKHKTHLAKKKMVCADCHGSVDKNGKITKVSAHIDGKVAPVKLYSSKYKTCTGICHWWPHFNKKW